MGEHVIISSTSTCPFESNKLCVLCVCSYVLCAGLYRCFLFPYVLLGLDSCDVCRKTFRRLRESERATSTATASSGAAGTKHVGDDVIYYFHPIQRRCDLLIQYYQGVATHEVEAYPSVVTYLARVLPS